MSDVTGDDDGQDGIADRQNNASITTENSWPDLGDESQYDSNFVGKI
jgi:hypothetical protein